MANSYYVLTCLFGAIGGSLFGYDLGVFGGVTSMDSFLKKFFQEVFKRKLMPHADRYGYCKYDNQMLTLFTSSLYFTVMVVTFLASYVTKKKGRKASIIVGAISFLLEAILNASAQDITPTTSGEPPMISIEGEPPVSVLPSYTFDDSDHPSPSHESPRLPLIVLASIVVVAIAAILILAYGRTFLKWLCSPPHLPRATVAPLPLTELNAVQAPPPEQD